MATFEVHKLVYSRLFVAYLGLVAGSPSGAELHF